MKRGTSNGSMGSSIGPLRHYSRFRCFAALLSFMFAIIFVAAFIFQIKALNEREWSIFPYKPPLFSGRHTKVLDICDIRNKSVVNNTVLDSTRADASCTRKTVLIKLKMELNEFPDPLVEKLADRTNILGPKILGGDKNDGNNNQLQEKLDDLQRMVNSLINFLPIKDVNFRKPPEEAQTLFMSSFDQAMEDQDSFLYFPSNASNGRILCVVGNDTNDGTKNRYALAWKDYLPPNFTLLHGVTYISKEYYYFNIFHSLRALGPFLYWYKTHESDKPERLVLYGNGEIKTAMCPWITQLVQAGIGYQVPIDNLQDYGGYPVCFEKSVVNRHGFGRFSRHGRDLAFDIIREKARRFCNVTKVESLPERDENHPAFNLTLLTRAGNRSFKNESAIFSIFQNECSNFPGCHFRVFRADDLTFCEQVEVSSATQVLVSVHGAQVTNMVFMDRGSRVAEIYPKGWQEFGGTGQFVFRWLANWAGMKHLGSWRDAQGPNCPNPEKGKRHCFLFFKNQRVGYNETTMSKWLSADVLNKVVISAPPARNTSN